MWKLEDAHLEEAGTQRAYDRMSFGMDGTKWEDNIGRTFRSTTRVSALP